MIFPGLSPSDVANVSIRNSTIPLELIKSSDRRKIISRVDTSSCGTCTATFFVMLVFFLAGMIGYFIRLTILSNWRLPESVKYGINCSSDNAMYLSITTGRSCSGNWVNAWLIHQRNIVI